MIYFILDDKLIYKLDFAPKLIYYLLKHPERARISFDDQNYTLIRISFDLFFRMYVFLEPCSYRAITLEA